MSDEGGPRSAEEATSELTLCVPAEAGRLRALRAALDRWAQRVGVAADTRASMVLAAYEAMANVVRHAYDDGPGELDLHAAYLPDQDIVQVTVADRGIWRPPGHGGLLHGRGLPLMRAMSQDTTIDSTERGTTVRMRWPRAQ